MIASTIGLDLAKHNFHVHAVDAAGLVIKTAALRRSEMIKFFQSAKPCLVGMEACATAHYWARELTKLGHEVKLIPPSYVKPFVRRGAKNDAADAAAICEAVRRPDMRFVAIKSEANQGFLMLHRARGLLVRQRTMAVCAIRAHLAEFGIIFGQGRQRIETIMPSIEEVAASLPEHARFALNSLMRTVGELNTQIEGIETKLAEVGRSDPVSNLLSSIPGVGPITSTAIAAIVPNARMFRSGREFAAWLGLTPRQNSSGGTTRLGGITKQGDAYLRHLLVIGARNIVRYPKARAKVGGAWIDALLQRRRPMIVAVAVANKLARIIWAMMTNGEMFREAHVKAA